MEKLIELHWQNQHDETVTGDAIIEYVRYDEDGKIVNEVTNVFLPEYIRPSQYAELKEQATKAFHNGEGFNL